MAIPELELLKAASAKDDQSQWPEFTLKNVKVTSKQTGELTSLLSAHAGFLLRVEGQLSDVDTDYAHLVKLTKYRKRTIEIDNVALYSFSQYDDGSLGFWAGGRAGWFEISSVAPRYQSIFDGMAEATGMFYYLADKYRNSRSKLLKEAIKTQDAHVRHLMYDYASSDYCRRIDSEDIREGFYEHHRFLIKSMLEGQEGLDWGSAPILRYLKRQFSADYREVQNIVLGESSAQDEAIEPEPSESSVVKPTNLSKARSQSIGGTKPVTPIESSQKLDEDEEGHETGLATPPPRKGKRKSYLRPRSERAAKRFSRYDPRTTRSQDTGEEDADIQDESESDASGHQAEEVKLPVTNGTALTGAIAPDIDNAAGFRKAPIPTYYEPRSPGDTWTCPYDGCNHKIWDARAQDSIELMTSHFSEAHENSMEDLINSESRPWAGVSHLLQRVRGFAAAGTKSNGSTLSEKALPERIVKRY